MAINQSVNTMAASPAGVISFQPFCIELCLSFMVLAQLLQSSHGCLLLPPPVRLGLGQAEALRGDCQQASQDTTCLWEPKVSAGYEAATAVFSAMAKKTETGSETATLWFPSLQDDSNMMIRLADVINENTELLGGVTAKTAYWPKVPATSVVLSWNPLKSSTPPRADTGPDEEIIDSAISATKEWVDKTLCRLSLCPYTFSLSRAAVGLESAGVREGPVVIHHTSSLFPGHPLPAVALAAAFWEGVTELATTPEKEVATLLILAPQNYDSDFLSFANVCDKLIEASSEAVGAEALVGRAWFHPLYNAAAVGHDAILPGHALPSSMVQGFVKQFDTSLDTLEVSNRRANSAAAVPAAAVIAQANDAVRWTPHATINLLRRSQLRAAKQVEAALPNKKPNAIYARNVLRILSDDGKLLGVNRKV